MKNLTLVTLSIFIFCSGYAQDKIPGNEALFQSSYVRPHNIVEKEPGHYFFDFKKDAFGALFLKFKESQSDSIVVILGEKLSDKNTIDRNPGGTIRYKRVVLRNITTDKQFCVETSKDGRNDRFPAVILPDSMGRIMPFRYCEIENLKIPVTEVEILQKVFNYRFNDSASAFSCSDTVLTQVWDLCKHTIKATSFCGKYVDGDRERIPYEADAFINQLSHYAVDSEYTLAQRTNEYFIDHPTWPTEWILHTVLLFYYDYLYTGNTKFLLEYYENLKNKTLMALERNDGLISTDSPQMNKELMNSVGFDIDYTGRKIEDIVDWPYGERDGYEMVSVSTVVNSFYYINLKLMAEIAEVLAKNEDAEMFAEKAGIVKKVMNSKLFDENVGVYVDGEGSTHSSLHANMFPLAFGIVPENNIPKVVAFVKSKGMACSVYGAQYLLEALYRVGEGDYALSLMNSSKGDRNWWNMIKTGSTMTMEAWDMRYKPNSDWNHAWGTAPANIITRYLWGIIPAKPGFEEVSIKPQLSNLTSSTIKVPTVKGAINANYKRLGNSCYYMIELPGKMQGVFSLETLGHSVVFLNGTKINGSIESLSLKSGKNQIEIKL